MSEVTELDQQLIARIATGDQDAYGLFIQRHLSTLVVFAYRHLLNNADAEDVAQEAMLRVWKHAASWRDQGASPRSWLFRITYNLCIDEIRLRSRFVDNETIEYEPMSNDLAQDFESAKSKEIYYQAIISLPQRQRSALILCAWHGLTNIEAANVMDISVDALESLLARGRRKLKKVFKLLPSREHAHDTEKHQTGH